MEFRVYRTWEYDKATKMKFDSLEELLEFTKQKQQVKLMMMEVQIYHLLCGNWALICLDVQLKR